MYLRFKIILLKYSNRIKTKITKVRMKNNFRNNY